MNVEMTLETLGFTKEDLQDRVIERLCEQMLHSTIADDEGESVQRDTRFKEKFQKAIVERIDAAVRELGEKHVLPNATAFLEGYVIQETTRWGEKKGDPVTFIEYLVQRADAYMREPVDFNGRPKSDGSYDWKGTQTRITQMIHAHLQFSIENAMKEALKNANASIAGGIQEAVKLKLAEILSHLTVSAGVGR